jgi:hypothetical protein
MMDGWMVSLLSLKERKEGRKEGREGGFLGLQFTTLNFTIPRKTY